ncbi:MAG: 2-oxo acid dehydrogenase subunit E2 [Chloroflexi bacterium]|nr:2-oxo acid dehydrogenase subunit E2 [Chloroflexota bacterium]
MITKIIMPEMGEGVVDGTVSRWLVAEGDFVKQYDPILEIETDKVTTEATAEEAGTILKLCVEEGAVVEVGEVLAYIGEPGDSVPENGEVAATATVVEAKAPESAQAELPFTPAPEQPMIKQPIAATPSPPPKRYTGRISPVVGRIAAENDVDLNEVTGSGRDGRITKKDILSHIEQRQKTPTPLPPIPPAPQLPRSPAPPPPRPPAPTSVPGEILPLTSMRRNIAEHMVRSKHTSPHVTTVFEVDFTAVDKHRRTHKAQFARDGAHLTFTAYIVAATVEALKRHPLVNSSWTDNGIELKREINVGVAAAIEDGLIVPVVKNADSLNLLGLARVVNDLTQRARNKQLKPADVQGGTFSITNHGVSGSLFATPIINQPQCGILGVGKIEKRVKVINDAIAIRTMAYMGATFDHRILDGASADHFMSTIKEVIENWQ